MSPARERPRPAPRPTRVRTPGRVRLRLDGWEELPCPVPHTHPGPPLGSAGQVLRVHCTTCWDTGHIWSREELAHIPGARGRLADSLMADTRAGRIPLGLGLYDGHAVYGHPDSAPPA